MSETNQTETAPEMLSRLGQDGMLWAEEFHKRFPTVEVEDAVGWFCNAIENAKHIQFGRHVHDDAAWLNYIEEVSSQRRLWDEIKSMPAEPRPAPAPLEPPPMIAPATREEVVELPKPTEEQCAYLAEVFERDRRARQYDPETIIGGPNTSPYNKETGNG